MWRIQHNMCKEWLILVGFDKFDALIKPVVRAKTSNRFNLPLTK